MVRMIDAPTSIDAEKQVFLKRGEKIIDIERIRDYSVGKESGVRPEYKK